MSKILIAYYTHSSNTKHIAKEIFSITNGDMIQIEPLQAYPTNYNAVVEQAKNEISINYHPPIKTKVNNINEYDVIFIGSPNWWSTIAPPVATFLEALDLSGKIVIPFITHGGGGVGRCKADIQKISPDAQVIACFEVYGDGGNELKGKIKKWIGNMNLS